MGDIKASMALALCGSCRYINHRGNAVAHAVAKLVMSDFISSVWIGDFPERISDCNAADIAAIH